jgi:hypothetical protein
MTLRNTAVARACCLALAVLAATCGRVVAATRTNIAALDAAATMIAALPKDEKVQAAAAHISQEGHWTLVNRAGEAFTAATPAELKRGFDVLLPNDAANSTRTLHLYLTAESTFGQRVKFSELPRETTLWVAGARSVRLIPFGSGASAKLLAEVRPNLLVELNDAETHADVMQQLARPLERSGFRQLSLEPGGPQTLTTRPKVDRATGRTASDSIDPVQLPKAIAALAGQTAVIVGRLEGDALFVKPSSAPERSLRWSELTAAATAADVNVLVLRSAAAQQPGARNWLWQKVEVKGLDNALTHANLGDFLDALGSATNRLVLSAQRAGDARMMLDVHRASGLPSTASSTAQVSSALSDMVSGLAGKVVHDGAVLHMRSAKRQSELDRRLISFLPADITWLYAALVAVGLLGLPVAWRWWARVWPFETAGEYRNAAGYWAARVIRGAVFALLFLPLVAVFAGPVSIFKMLARRKQIGRRRIA